MDTSDGDRSGMYNPSATSASRTLRAYTPTSSVTLGAASTGGRSSGFQPQASSEHPFCPSCTCKSHSQAFFNPSSSQDQAAPMSDLQHELLYTEEGEPRNDAALSYAARDYMNSGDERDHHKIAILASGKKNSYIRPPPDFKSRTEKQKTLYKSLSEMVSKANGILPHEAALDFTNSNPGMHPLYEHLQQKWIERKGEKWQSKRADYDAYLRGED